LASFLLHLYLPSDPAATAEAPRVLGSAYTMAARALGLTYPRDPISAKASMKYRFLLDKPRIPASHRPSWSATYSVCRCYVFSQRTLLPGMVSQTPTRKGQPA